MATKITNTSKNSNLFGKMYSTVNDIQNSGYKCNSAVNETQTSFDISGSEGQITDSNGNVLASIDLAAIHADGLQEYYTETKILAPQSAYLLQGNVLGETYSAQFFPVLKDIQDKEGYESYINIAFDIHYSNCDEMHAIHIDTSRLRTEPGSVCEIIQNKLDSLKVPVSCTIRRLPVGNCPNAIACCPDCATEIDYLVFQSSEEGYSFYVHSVTVSAIDIDYMNYDNSWSDYSESPFVGAVIDFDYVIDLIKTKRPRLIGEQTNPLYENIPCDIYKYVLNIALVCQDDPIAFKHNVYALSKFAELFTELGELKEGMEQRFETLKHLYPDVYEYYWGNEYSILNKYNINDILDILNEIGAYVAQSNVIGRPREMFEDFAKRIYNQKYFNGAFRGIVLIPDWPSDLDDYSVLKIAHVPDYIYKQQKIEIPENMHIEGFICNTCIDAFIKIKSLVKINTLLQSEYEIYKKDACNCPVRKVTSNEQLATCVDEIWTYDLHGPITNIDMWTGNDSQNVSDDDIWTSKPFTHIDHHKHNHKVQFESIDEFDKSKYAFLDNIPKHHHDDEMNKSEYPVCGLYGYMGYLNENDLWTRVGQAYMVIGAKDDYQSKVKNLLNSVLVYNPNTVPIRIKYIVFS